MKKLCFVVLLAAVMITLVSCRDSEGRTFAEFLDDRYPYIEYRNSSYNFDSKNEKIEMIDGYVLNQGNSYDWIETADGYDLIIHFKKGGE
jgi:hypothetical protein